MEDNKEQQEMQFEGSSQKQPILLLTQEERIKPQTIVNDIEANIYEGLLTDAERSRKKQKITKKQINENIDRIILFLEKTLIKINNDSSMNDEQSEKKLKDNIYGLHCQLTQLKPLTNILVSNKEYFAYISKFGKNIEKGFNRDLNNIFDECEFEKEQLYKVIGEHFFRENQQEICQSLQQETGVKLNYEYKDYFDKISKIINELKQKITVSAIKWANCEDEKLNKINSNLQFNFHQLEFANILQNQGVKEAQLYAKKYFLQFIEQNQKTISRLMTSFCYQDNLCQSVYADLYEEKIWDNAIENLICDSCKIYCKIFYKIPPKSSLFLAVTAGTLSMPQFIKLSTILQNNEDLKNKNELPIDIEIGKDFKFHSLFCCPVSREISHPNEPPFLLKCGHVISQLSLKKITQNEQKTKFKCPTCQTLLKSDDKKEIYF